MRRRAAFRIAALSLIASVLACAVRLVDAQNLSITVSPRLPTTEDMISVTVDFFFASQPPYVKDFGTPTLHENIFTVNVTIYRPAPSDIVLYWTHDDVHTYDLGEMSKGNYEFRVVVTLTHYNEGMQYLAGSIRFKVSDRPVEIFDTTGSDGIPDGRVDMWDLANVAIRFGHTPGDALWNPRADVNGDNIINMADLAAVAWHFGERYA